MKLGLTLLLFLSTLTAHAEIRMVAPANSKTGVSVSIDMKVFQELNEMATKIPQEELDQNWSSFLSTGHFQTSLSKEANTYLHRWLIYSPYSSGKDVVTIDGSLPLPLLKSIARVYWADLQKVIEIGTDAIRGSSDDEILQNSRVVYSCIIQSSQLTEPEPECQNVIGLTTLSKQEFATLSEAYLKVMRSGTLKFTHQYCEVYQDRELNQLQKEMTKQMDTFLDWSVGPVSSLFNKKMLLNLPFFFPRLSKFNGPQFTLCGTKKFMHLSYVGNP